MKAGYRRDQIAMGMPTWVDTRGSGGLGATMVDHLREVRAPGAGVGLWDMQLSAPGWTKPATRDAVQALRRPGNAPARRWPPVVDRGTPRGPSVATMAVSERTSTAASLHPQPSATR